MRAVFLSGTSFLLVFAGLTARASGAENGSSPDSAGVAWLVATEECGASEPFRRAVELACDAVAGACRVQADPARQVGATERDPRYFVTLRCQSHASRREGAATATATLNFASSTSSRSYSVSLQVDGNDLVSHAALLVARTNPRDLFDDTKAAQPMGAGSPPGARAVPALTPRASSVGMDRPAAPTPKERTSSGGRGLAAMVRGSLSGDLAPSSLGGRVMGVLPLGGASVGFAGGAERGIRGPADYTLTQATLSLAIHYGAPFSDRWFGLGAEVGGVLGIVDANGRAPASQRYLHPRAAISGVVRPFELPAVQPFVAVGAALQLPVVHVTDENGFVASVPAFSGSVDLGVAWRL